MKTEKIGGIEYVTLEGMKAGATIALECTKSIRQWLPIKASKKALASLLTMDQWFERMASLCIEFHSYRSLDGSYATVGPMPSSIAWRELCIAMAELRDHYNVPLDNDIAMPHSNVRGGEKIKPIDPSILYRIVQAASAIHGFDAAVELERLSELVQQSPPPNGDPVDATKAAIQAIEDCLTNNSRRLFSNFKTHENYVMFDDIKEWGIVKGGPKAKDAAVEKSLKRLNVLLSSGSLVDYGFSIEIRLSELRAKLNRPDKSRDK